MNRWLVILLFFSLAVNIAVVGTMVYHRSRYPGPADRVMPGRVRQAPDRRENLLNREERQRIAELRRIYQKKMQRMHGTIDSLRVDLMDVMRTKPTNKDLIDRLLKEIGQKQLEMEKITIHHLLSIRTLLTEEQWQRLLFNLERSKMGRKVKNPRTQPKSTQRRM